LEADSLDPSSIGGRIGVTNWELRVSIEYAKELGARLRTIRQQQGLSLHGVEQKSRGRWKAVVVGSYERGDRAITVSRMADLAGFYGVPVTELLPDNQSGSRVRQTPPARVVIDLERLNALPREQAGPVARFAAAIQSARGDYNGRVLTVRRDDLLTLAMLYDEPTDVVVDRLVGWGILEGEARVVAGAIPRARASS
jgi:transcriptional regulator with XRE-family HTH domain